jgi:hypothetical protein
MDNGSGYFYDNEFYRDMPEPFSEPFEMLFIYTRSSVKSAGHKIVE